VAKIVKLCFRFYINVIADRITNQVAMTDTQNNVVQLRPEKVKQASDKKWGKEVMKLGFSIIPSLLLRSQQRLGLNPTQLAILMQLADYWWDDARKPFPSKQALSERLGISPRQIQRYIAEMEKAGLVQRIERRAAHQGKLSNTYDLTGLVERLKKLEPEFSEVREETKNLRRQVSRRGGIKNLKTEKTA
jgi:predicted transcriptional regulator